MTISTTYRKPSIANSLLSAPRCELIHSTRAWAVVLAGGDGLPRRPGVPADLRGQRPRHFLRTAYNDYIINQTRKHVSLSSIPPERTMLTVSEDDLHYFHEVADDVSSQNIIVEPQDDGSTLAIMYSLLRVKEKDPNATVVFFPPDLSVPDPKSFMARVHDGIDAVNRGSRLILLGVEPAGTDADRQWIEPDKSVPIHGNENVRRVLRLWNAASHSQARELIKRGGLWNSSVMVGKISTFLAKIRHARPEIHSAFMAAAAKIGTPGEAVAMRRIYFRNYTESDFTRDVLMNCTDDLAVIPVPGVKVQGVARTSGSEVSSLLRGTPRGIAAAIGG